jgi:hypothetical protein
MVDSHLVKRNSPELVKANGGSSGWVSIHYHDERDRREATRRAVSLEVDISDATGARGRARVFNLSLSGMLVADLPFIPEVGSVHEFALDIRGKRTVLNGVVRRRQNTPQFGNAAGVAFVGMPTAVRDALCDYLFGGPAALKTAAS